MLISIAAWLLTAGAAVGLYLATPNQQWLRAPWPATPALIATVLALLAAGVLWSLNVHPATALCVLLSIFMAVLIALPCLMAMLRGRSARARS